MTVYIGWAPSNATGWGLVANRILFELFERGVECRFLQPPSLQNLDPILLGKFIDQALILSTSRLAVGAKPVTFQPGNDKMLISMLNSELVHDEKAKMYREIRADLRAICFFEEFTDTPVDPAIPGLDLLVGSTWNKRVLSRYYGCEATVAIQGDDHALTHPYIVDRSFPLGDRARDKLRVFSGGKLEYRKGQDLTVEIMKQILAQRDDVEFVLGWANARPVTYSTIERGCTRGAPKFDGDHVAAISRWLGDNGIDLDRVTVLPLLPRWIMQTVMNDCDVGLFPSRAEGGTNLPAMEMLATGKTVFLSEGTGHEDLRKYKSAVFLPSSPIEYPQHFEPKDRYTEVDVGASRDMILDRIQKHDAGAPKASEYRWADFVALAKIY